MGFDKSSQGPLQVVSFFTENCWVKHVVKGAVSVLQLVSQGNDSEVYCVNCALRGGTQGAEPGSGVQRFWGPLGEATRLTLTCKTKNPFPKASMPAWCPKATADILRTCWDSRCAAEPQETLQKIGFCCHVTLRAPFLNA